LLFVNKDYLFIIDWNPMSIALTVLSSISLIGSASIVLAYSNLSFKTSFALQMVAYLSILHIIFSIANFLYI